MRAFTHIVNLGSFPRTSELHCAQLITVETLRIAREFAAGRVEVRLLSAQYGEDRDAVPAHMVATPDLERSVLDVGEFRVERKLPLVRDILDRAFEAAESDYMIFSNVDIGLLPSFYASVGHLIDSGFDAFAINRRTIPNGYTSAEELPLMWAEVGQAHMGYDCFVFKREAYREFSLGLICVGAPHIGRAMLVNQILTSHKSKVFHDQHLTFHIGNDKRWKAGEFRGYELHNRAELGKIMGSLSAAQKRTVRKSLAGYRLRGLKNKAANYLGLNS